jgi:hypothetical protein
MILLNEHSFVSKTEAEVKQAKLNAFPHSTKKKVMWATSLFEDWRAWRNMEAGTNHEFSLKAHFGKLIFEKKCTFKKSFTQSIFIDIL